MRTDGAGKGMDPLPHLPSSGGTTRSARGLGDQIGSILGSWEPILGFDARCTSPSHRLLAQLAYLITGTCHRCRSTLRFAFQDSLWFPVPTPCTICAGVHSEVLR